MTGRNRALAAPLLAALAAILLLAPAPAGAERPLLGVVPQQPLAPLDLQRMGAGGVDSFRLWLGWSAVEEVAGEYRWAAYDELIAAAAASGVTPLPYLYGTPGWAAGLDRQACVAEACIPFAPRSGPTRAAFAAFAAEAVRRYGPSGSFWSERPELPYHPIRAWQIWNEQNITDYWRPRPDVGGYAALLRAAARAIKSVDPEAEIVLGGMWGPRRAPDTVVTTSRFLRKLYRRHGIKHSFDGLGVHPYDPRLKGVLRQVRRLRRAAARHGDPKVGVWVTELGWASGGPRRESLVKDRREQARLLRRSFGELRRRGARWRIRGIYWYAWRDTRRSEAICRWCPRAGLLDVAGATKPAWHRFTALARR